MKNRLKELLQKYRSHCDYIELRAEKSSKFKFGMKKEGVDKINRSSDLGLAIRTCHNGGWGFASIDRIEDLEHFVKLAIDQAHLAGKGKTVLADIEPIEDTVFVNVREDPRLVSLEEKLDIFHEYRTGMLNHSPEIFNVHLYYDDTSTAITYVNTDGACLETERLDLTFMCIPLARKGDVAKSVYLTGGSSNDFSVVRNRSADIEAICERSLELIRAPVVKAGAYPVVVNAALGGVFIHEAFGHTSEADEYINDPKMKEVMTLGRRFGSNELNVYDTGLDEGTRGHLIYDDEGVPTQRTDLIRDGILVGRLHNRESAGRFNEAVTGNARALNFIHPPICRMRNTCVSAGTATLDDLFEGIDLGVYAVNNSGGSGGEMFSFNAEYGYMIRNGKRAEMVRDLSISGNLFKTLKQIDRIGNDFTITNSAGGCGKGSQFPLPVSWSSPSFRISEAKVGGAQ